MACSQISARGKQGRDNLAESACACMVGSRGVLCVSCVSVCEKVRVEKSVEKAVVSVVVKKVQSAKDEERRKRRGERFREVLEF